MQVNDRFTKEIEVVEALYRYNVAEKYTERCKRYNSLVYYVKGGHRFVFADKVMTACEGGLLFLPMGAKYENSIISGDTEYYQINFRLNEKNPLAAPLDGAYIIEDAQGLGMYERMKNIYDAYTMGEAGHDYICAGEIMKIMGLLLLRANEVKTRALGLERIEKTVSFINENYQLDTSVQELARISSTCTSNLEKLFKKCFGKTPVQYRNEIRIRNACRLLSGGVSINETALRTGFSDQCHFSNVFKRLCGKTPGEYVKQAREEW